VQRRPACLWLRSCPF